jgi:HK97 family phage portal protein
VSLLDAVLGRADRPARRSLENPSVPLSSVTGWDDEEGWLTGDSSRRFTAGRVNRTTALGYAPWWRGVHLLARGVAKVPCHVYRRSGDGKERDPGHPAYPLVRRKANRYQTAFQFKLQMAGQVLDGGNAYAWAERNGVSAPLALWPLNPDATYPVRANGELSYVTEAAGRQARLAAEDVLHFKGLGFDGLTGYSPRRYARETVDLGVSARRYCQLDFKNSGRPAVVLEAPGALSQPAVERLKAGWQQMYTGLENSHKTAVLFEGLKAHVLSYNHNDLQLQQIREMSRQDVADVLGLPAHKLGDTGRTSFASLEQENQDYLDDSLDPLLCTFEDEFTDKLMTERQKAADTHFCEFLRESLMRADMTAKSNYYNKATGGRPWMTQREVRQRENLNPLDGPTADVILEPLNMATQGTPPAVAGGKVKDLLAVAEAVQSGAVAPAAALVIVKQSWPDLPAAQAAALVASLAAAEPPPAPAAAPVAAGRRRSNCRPPTPARRGRRSTTSGGGWPEARRPRRPPGGGQAGDVPRVARHDARPPPRRRRRRPRPAHRRPRRRRGGRPRRGGGGARVARRGARPAGGGGGRHGGGARRAGGEGRRGHGRDGGPA